MFSLNEVGGSFVVVPIVAVLVHSSLLCTISAATLLPPKHTFHCSFVKLNQITAAAAADFVKSENINGASASQ